MCPNTSYSVRNTHGCSDNGSSTSINSVCSSSCRKSVVLHRTEYMSPSSCPRITMLQNQVIPQLRSKMQYNSLIHHCGLRSTKVLTSCIPDQVKRAPTVVHQNLNLNPGGTHTAFLSFKCPLSCLLVFSPTDTKNSTTNKVFFVVLSLFSSLHPPRCTCSSAEEKRALFGD